MYTAVDPNSMLGCIELWDGTDIHISDDIVHEEFRPWLGTHDCDHIPPFR